MRVVWLRGAVAELKQMESYVAERNELAAQRLRVAMIEAARSLAWSPERGAAGANGTRRMLVGNYVLRYAVRDDVVAVVSLRHGARSDA